MNINTKAYWDDVFKKEAGESQARRDQTRGFAETQVKYFKIPSAFSGKILDFGCGLGDAFPVYRKAYPLAQLIGADLSEVAIENCVQNYGDLGQFISGDYRQVPEVDVIIASNVFEHLSNDEEIARHLLKKCKDMYIIVPYKEEPPLSPEHINIYDENYFKALKPKDYFVFASKGWSEAGWYLWVYVYLMNLIRRLLGMKVVRRRMQIMFHFTRDGQ